MNIFGHMIWKVIRQSTRTSQLPGVLVASAILSIVLILDVIDHFNILSIPATFFFLGLTVLLLFLYWKSTRHLLPTAHHVLAAIILLLLGISLATKLHLEFTLSKAKENWHQFSRISLQRDTETMRNTFSEFLGSTEAFVRDITADVSLQQALIDPNIENRARLFQILMQSEPEFRGDYGLEAFDNNKESVAWVGTILPPHEWTRQHDFSDEVSIFILRGQMYTLLGVSGQVHDGTNRQHLGTVIVYRPLQVNVPVQSSFFGKTNFAQDVSSVVRSTFRLEFLSSGKNLTNSNTWLPADNEEISVVLSDSGNRTLGVARFAVPNYQGFELSESQKAARLLSLFLALMLLIYLYMLVGVLYNQTTQTLDQQNHPLLKGIILFLGMSWVLWITRYGLLLLEFPQRLVDLSLFDPIQYASSFLFGLSRSPGDLLITLLFLVSHIYLAWRIGSVLNIGIEKQTRHRKIRIVVLLPAMVCLYVLFDAYISGVRSFVRDSTLSFFRYLDFFTSAPLAVTIVNLFLLSFSFVLVGLLIVHCVQRFLRFSVPVDSLRFVCICLAYLSIGIFWTIVSKDQVYCIQKMIFIFGIVFFAIWLDRSMLHRSFQTLIFLLMLTVACAFLSFPIFHSEVMNEEENLIRLRTAEALETTETMIRLMVENSLNYFRLSENIHEALLDDEISKVKNVAFVEWIKSPLSHLNFGSSITILNARGREVSHFSIDIPLELNRAAYATVEEIEETEGTFITVSSSRIEGEEINLYTGAVPILSDEQLIGAVILSISVVKNPLQILAGFVGMSPTPMRSLRTGKEYIHPYGPINTVISMFEREMLVESTDPDLLRGYRPADWILDAIFDQKMSYVRAEETIGETRFVNFYFPQKTDAKVLGMVSVGYKDVGTLTYIYNFLRLLFTYLLFFIVIYILYRMIMTVTSGHIRRMVLIRRFQNKLIFSFTLLIIFPMLFTAYFGRHIILSQQEERTQSQIEKDLLLGRTLIEEETIASAQHLASQAEVLNIYTSFTVPGLDTTEYTEATVSILDSEGNELWRNRSEHTEYEMSERFQAIFSPRLLYSHRPQFSVGVIVPIFGQEDAGERKGFIQYFRPVDDALCRTISRRIERDITVYHRGEEIASTRPELFQSELISTKLPGDAVLSIELLAKSYFYARRQMGDRPYIEGYIPFVDQIGRTAGVLSIPTIYQQRRFEQETAKTISIILVLYALIFSITLIIGLILSRRISSPVKVLTEGTRQIATGDLDFRIKMKAKDELGDLVASFNKMTTDLKASQEQLIQAEKDAAWREMARQVAHEVKNPLTPMKLSIQHLMQAYTDKAENFDTILSATVQMVSEQIDVLRNIASEFSSFARLPRRDVKECNINEILQSSIRLFTESLEGIQLVTEYHEPMISVRIDPEEMQRVFVNLIQNALQAMPQGGTIRLHTELHTDHQNGNERRAIVIEIADTGCGIPEEMQDMLFEPSFSTKTEGTGLGLAICKRVIDDLEGTIEIESKVGKGTTVRIMLPADSSALQEFQVN
jgi:signal transduction histidine kinase